jgi:hypothetical protein
VNPQNFVDSVTVLKVASVTVLKVASVTVLPSSGKPGK